MLTINVSHDANDTLRYFKESLVKEGNYYLDKEVKAYWQGNTAKYLDLQGKEVTEKTFGQLASNIDHRSGERLTVRHANKRRSSVDWTFSAPKSVSIAYALTKDKVILEAHRTAYRAAMAQVEKMMYTQSNTQHERGYTHTGNIIYAAFDHELARPVKQEEHGQKTHVADPQLHTHCVMPNVTWNPQKKRYEAVEIFNAHTHSAFVNATYHSVLSLELEKAGYQTERTPENFTLAGIGRDVVERFSLRTQQIEKVAKKKGITNAKAKGELGAKTRAGKSAMTLSDGELYQNWKGRLSQKEFQQIISLKGRSFKRQIPINPKEAIDKSLQHFLERNSVVNKKKVIAHATSLGYGQLTIQDVTKALHARVNILGSERDTIKVITTKEMVQKEDHMINLATAGKGKYAAINKDYSPKQDFLNQEQRKAIKAILSAYDQTVILRGAAGVGKTSLLTEVRNGVTQAGKNILAVAPSSQASKVLEEKGFESATIAALLANPRLQEKLRNNVLLVDEAGMCGVKSMSQILNLAKKHNTRTILSGDTKQHGPPAQYGDALRILEKQSRLQVSTVGKIVRQKDKKYNEAVTAISKGQILQGYQKLDRQGSVIEMADHQERIDRLAEDYIKTLGKKRSALIISPTHFEGDQINGAVRQKLRQKGLIQGEEKTFEVLRDISLTEAQKQDIVHYHAGQVVRFAKNTKGGFRAGSHHEVIGIGKDKVVKVRDIKTGKLAVLPHQTPEHYGVYNKQNIMLAKHDRIRLTHNTVSLQGTKMNNGTSYQIKGFSKRGIELSNGKTVPPDLFHMRHAYCETSHSAQGKDAHSVFLSMGGVSHDGVNEQSFYVGISRGTKEISVYCSDKSALKKSIVRSGERLSARDIAKEHRQRLHAQKQQAHYKNLEVRPKYHERIQGREKIATRGISKEFTKH